MGSLAAIPFWYLMTFLPWQLYSLVVMLGICIGVYLCHQTAKDMGVHDHGSIVWDEIVPFWLVLLFSPAGWLWQTAAFLLFRIFDIVKPQPARYFDTKVKNGFGVMTDDLFAGVYTVLVLQIVAFLLS